MRLIRRVAAPLVGFGLVMVAFGIQGPVPPSIRRHVEALESAPGLEVKLTYQPLTGESADYTLKFSRPNLIRVEGGGQIMVMDGKSLIRYDKTKNTYSEEPEAGKFYEMLTDPRLWIWGGFFEKPAVFRGFKGAKEGRDRQVKGFNIQEVEVSFANGSSATVYVDRDSGLARGGSASMATGGYMVFASDIKTEAIPQSDFAFKPPAGAKKADQVSAVNGVARFVNVQGIFQSRCMPCHGAMSRGGVNLSSYEGVLKTVIKGKPEMSRLIRMISGARPKMPQGGAPLTQTQVALISAWIKAGARK